MHREIVSFLMFLSFLGWSVAEARGQRLDPSRPGSQRRTLQERMNSTDKGLRVGDMAPDFTLRTLDGDGEFELGSFAGKKPVVLIFGSYT